MATGAGVSSQPGLKRALGLRHLVVMGVILIQPTAPMAPFGAISAIGNGHAVTTVLIALCAMLLTALSYGRMARIYPNAGSAYTYVGKEIHPVAGYAAGWSMLLDYLVNPLICTIWCARAIENLIPGVPYAASALFFALLFTMLNLRGIQATARVNQVLASAMGLVIVWMLAAAARYVLQTPELGTARFFTPFYDPDRFSLASLSAGTSVAVLTYIGFDGISTLSEEVRNPRVNIPRATILVCLIIGLLSAIQVYAAQVVWPLGQPFPDQDTAYLHVARLAGGDALFQVLGITLIVATIGSGSGAQLAGARLLYGMGRDNALPKPFFGYVDPARQIPSRNVLLIGGLCLAGAFTMSYQLGAELLNFGALLGFMGVNLSVILRYWVRREDRRLRYLVPPALGFAICFYLWLSLSNAARIAGIVWLAVGLAYGAWKTSGFRRSMVRFEAPSE
mgnify:CR=1|jgi:Amino acid transporters